MTERVLVAEDEEILRRNLCDYLSKHGYDVTGVEDGEKALEKLLEEDFAVVVTDIRMPHMDGITLLKRVTAERPETRVLVTTAFASVDTAVEALRYGAFDYLLKPITFEDLLQKVNNLVAYRALENEVRRLRRDLQNRLGSEGFIGDSAPIQKVFDLIDKVAPTRSTVLITGESGTGKELVARAIWSRSGLSEREFLAVNTAAIPSEMVEAQLFGHEKGAFTGADRRREGYLRIVRGGTVFLDEIGELPVQAQAKLLRALENGEVSPVGAERPAKAEFRLVAATNQDLEKAVEAGEFRQDLFFRINVFRIAVPPLRERREDIPALVSHFIERHAQSVGKRAEGVSNAAMKLLLAYHWPGNVRELSNVIERATILASGVIEPGDLPAELQAGEETSVELRPAVEQFERRHIAWVLDVAGGNRERAARMLGVDPATLYRRLSKYEIR
jgi:two-component system response regulator PilR (NtrC family)